MCLQAAQRWDAPLLRGQALKALEVRGPAVKIAAARKYEVNEWLRPALNFICTLPRNSPHLSVDDLQFLDIGDIANIMKAREEILVSGVSRDRLGNVLAVNRALGCGCYRNGSR
jgi:hypothetical protein